MPAEHAVGEQDERGRVSTFLEGMTMLRPGLAAAAAALLCWAGGARADSDLVRLGGTGDANVATLGTLSTDADTVLTRGYGGHGGYRGGGHYGGGHRSEGHTAEIQA